MSTLITVKDVSGNYSALVFEDFPLDLGMLDANDEFRYSIGTTDVKRQSCKAKVKNLIVALKRSLLNRRRVNEVIISSDIEYAKFVNPLLNFEIASDNELYVEISATEIYTGIVSEGESRNIRRRKPVRVFSSRD